MKILYLHQYFRTPEQGGAVRSYHVASAMVNDGHSVEMLTTHNSSEYETKDINGIKTHYLPIPYRNEMGSIQRIWSFLKFAFHAYRLGKTIDSDLVYATSTPLTIGWTALKLKKNKGIPFIFEVRDLWPEVPEKLGIISNAFLLKKAYKLEKRIYAEAHKIIALSPTMAKGINTPQKTHTIPNFSNNYRRVYVPTTTNTPLKIIYTGALGYANDIPFLIKLIKLVDEKFTDRIELIFIGEGKFGNTISKACDNSSSAIYLGFLPQNEVFHHISNSHAVLTTFLDNKVLESNSPNKFFDGLAHGKIALINFGGWLEEIITTHNCGRKIDALSMENVFNALLKDSSLVKTLQANAKKVALEKFDKDTLCQKITNLLEE